MSAVAVAAIFVIAGVAGLVAFIIGQRAGQAGERRRLMAAGEAAEVLSGRIIAEGERTAEALRKTAVLTGKEELMKLREAWEGDIRGRREDVERGEKRLKERDTILDRKFEVLDQREKETGARVTELSQRVQRLADREQEVDRLTSDAQRRLEQLAGMSATDAKAELIHRMEEAAHAEAANRLREIRESARRNAEREGKKIVALAIQRIAAEHTAESTAAAVALPNDEE